MNSILKIGMIGGAIALLVWGAKAAQKTLSDFRFDIVGYGKPTINGWNLTVPLQIKYKNPTPLPINVDQLIGDIYLNKNGTFVLAAKVNQPVTLDPGTSLQWLYPALDLQAVFGGSLANTILAIQEVINRKTLTIRSDITAVYGGITLPMQSITNEIDLA